MTTATATYLEPAEALTGVESGRLEVRLRSGLRAYAHLALAMPYRPVPGDELLVIGNDVDDLYIIGLLRGLGLTKLTVPGDLAIDAPHGAISLSAAGEIKLESHARIETCAPQVAVRADRLDIFANRTIQKFANAYTWCTGLFQLKSARMRSVTDEGYFLKAGRAHIRTKENCVINAKTIHLG